MTTCYPSVQDLPIPVLERWADALESGDYPQGRENMQTDQGFCCLGVLADLYCQDTGDQWDTDWTPRMNSAHPAKALRGVFGGLPGTVWKHFAPGFELESLAMECELLPVIPMTDSLIEKTGGAEPSARGGMGFHYLNDIGPRPKSHSAWPSNSSYSFAEIAAIVREYIQQRKEAEAANDD